MQVLFVGLDNAGKSSIKVYLETLSRDKALNTKISNGIEVYSRGELTIRIIPGQYSLRMNEKFYKLYLPSSDVLVFVVDAADKKRFDAVKDFWRFIIRKLREFGKENIRIIVLAHKRDIEGSVSSEEIKRLLGSDVEGFNVSFLDTSIFDYVSMVNLLNMIHKAREVGIDEVLEDIRSTLNADIAFLYDRHLLPVSIAIKEKPDMRIFDRISSIVVETEKLGEVKALILFFTDGANLLVLGKRLPEERIVVGAYNIRKDLREAVKIFSGLYEKYREIYRQRLWASW